MTAAAAGVAVVGQAAAGAVVTAAVRVRVAEVAVAAADVAGATARDVTDMAVVGRARAVPGIPLVAVLARVELALALLESVATTAVEVAHALVGRRRAASGLAAVPGVAVVALEQLLVATLAVVLVGVTVLDRAHTLVTMVRVGDGDSISLRIGGGSHGGSFGGGRGQDQAREGEDSEETTHFEIL